MFAPPCPRSEDIVNNRCTVYTPLCQACERCVDWNLTPYDKNHPIFQHCPSPAVLDKLVSIDLLNCHVNIAKPITFVPYTTHTEASRYAGSLGFAGCRHSLKYKFNRQSLWWSFLTLHETICVQRWLSNLCASSKLLVGNHPIPRHILSFVAGFVDGDGCISTSHQSARLSITQAHNAHSPPVLQYIHALFGGIILQAGCIKPNRRQKWQLYYHHEHTVWVLNMLAPYLVLKQNQARMIEQFATVTDIVQKTVHAEAIRVAHQKTSYLEVLPAPETITIPYIAGLFDAEGCVRARGGAMWLVLTQKQSLQLLHAIAKYVEQYNVRSHVHLPGLLYWHSKSALIMCQLLHPHMVQKRLQMELVIANQDLYGNGSRRPFRFPPLTVLRQQRIATELSRLKRL